MACRSRRMTFHGLLSKNKTRPPADNSAKLLKKPRGVALVEHIVRNDKIEMAPIENALQRRTGKEFDIRRQSRGTRRIGGKCDDRQRALAARYLGQLPGERAVATPDFENFLSRQQMHNVAKRLSAPQHPVVKNGVAPLPICLSHLFPQSERVGQG